MQRVPGLTVLIKLAVVVLIIKEVWLLLQVPSIADAVLSFIMVGLIPGTDTSLTPNQMMSFLVAVFVIVSALVFRKELVVVAKRLFNRTSRRETAVPLKPAKMPITHPRRTSAAAIHAERLPIAAIKHWLQFAQGKWAAVAPRLLTARHHAKNLCMRVLVTLRRVAIAGWSYAVRGMKIAGKILLVLYILASALTVALWRWAKPHIHKFDRWLDRKLHQNEYTSAVLAVGNDVLATLQAWMADIKDAVSKELSPKQRKQ